ncbi:anti-sigma factor domain-containing protein [Laceyella putida]|uniref:Anti-sigma factor domain-containing protein n=1 Tax=Laceyella putida TaxID=110101 RepID=A0ABW2RPZ2_9BACL
MQRGIIMEVQARHWIVLTPDGDFIKVPRTNHSLMVGEEVTLQAAKTNRRALVPAFVSVAAAAVLGMFFIVPQMAPDQAHAQTYIYVDVNPSLEIGIDDERNIVELHPLNKSAEKLLDGEKWKHESVDDFVVDFLDKAKQMGYVQKRDQVVLSGYQEEKNSKETLDNLKTVLDKQSKQKNLELEVHSLVMPKKVKDKASRFGLSPVKYAAWMIAKKEGKQLEVEEMGETPLTDLADELAPVSELLNKPEALPELVEIIEKEPPAVQPTQEPKPADKPTQPAATPADQGEPTQQPVQDNQQPDQGDSTKKPSDPEGTNQTPTDNQTTDTSQNTETQPEVNTTQETQ